MDIVKIADKTAKFLCVAVTGTVLFFVSVFVCAYILYKTNTPESKYMFMIISSLVFSQFIAGMIGRKLFGKVTHGAISGIVFLCIAVVVIIMFSPAGMPEQTAYTAYLAAAGAVVTGSLFAEGLSKLYGFILDYMNK